jgi:hypothetical protein
MSNARRVMDSLIPASTLSRVRAFAGLVVADECRKHGVCLGARLVGFVDTVSLAVIDFVGARVSRFPRLAQSLPGRFAADRLPCSTVRAARAVARTAFALRLHPPAKPKAPRIHRCPRRPAEKPASIYVIPAGGLGRRRTLAGARAAGFSSIEAWVDALMTSSLN